jgi:glutaminyl-peptide cyclotransferase
MLTQAKAVHPSKKQASMAFLCMILLLISVPNSAQGQSVSEPYQSVEPCGFVEELEFNGTLANASITEQVNLGPRTTGSNASADLRSMIHEQLTEWQVSNHTYTEDNLTFTNVVAKYSAVEQTLTTPRVVLVAHYDTRDVAERDPDVNRTGEPIPGANDGASGVAVLLELGRLIPSMGLSYEVELLFTDAEDQNHSSKLYGAEAWVERQTADDKNRTSAYIVVDMVGDAFLQLTHVYPGDAKLWSTISPLASAIGLVETKADCNGMFGRDVVNLSISTGVIDDHVPALNNGIRAIDLIDIRFGPDAEPFGGYWHTHEDTPDKVSAQSLEDVGRLVELGLRSDAWSTTITLANTTTVEEGPVLPATDVESETLETYVWMGAAALLSLLAALVFVLILSRAVDLKP